MGKRTNKKKEKERKNLENAKPTCKFYANGRCNKNNDCNLSSMSSRSSSRGDLQVKGKTELRQSSFVNDAANNWNTAPNIIKQSKSLFSAKREIKKFVQTLPI